MKRAMTFEKKQRRRRRKIFHFALAEIRFQTPGHCLPGDQGFLDVLKLFFEQQKPKQQKQVEEEEREWGLSEFHWSMILLWQAACEEE